MKLKDKLKELLRDETLEDKLELIECRLNELEESVFTPLEEEGLIIFVPQEVQEAFIEYTGDEIRVIGKA